jgi:Protein of unknown function (DUF742)
VSDNETWFDEEAGPVVRPYMVTRGRTRPANSELELVALVGISQYGVTVVPHLQPEEKSIAILCHQLQSIAEISARLGLPLGVTRVLVGDMADAGILSVQRPVQPTERPDVALLEKVLHGLRTL